MSVNNLVRELKKKERKKEKKKEREKKSGEFEDRRNKNNKLL